MARLGRRQSFKPILSGLIQYQPAPAVPVSSKLVAVSFAARQSATAFRIQRPRVLLSRLSFVVRATPALGSRGYAIYKASVNAAAQRPRTRIVKAASLVEPAVVTPTSRVRPKIRIKHDEARIGSRGRGHEQQVSAIINGLGRTGELIGSVPEPALGYLAADPSAVGTTEVLPMSEVLDRVIAAIKALNGTGI